MTTKPKFVELSEIAESKPENLIFWSNEDLCYRLKNEKHFPCIARANMYAELLVRAYFNPQSKIIADCLSEKLPQESLDLYNAWSLIASPSNTPPLLDIISQLDKNAPNRDFLDDVQSAARERFSNLLGRCDGIVPVIIRENDDVSSCAIPFRLKKLDDSVLENSEGRCVIDCDGIPVPEWCDAVSKLNLRDVCVQLLFHSSDVKFEGYSLQLPVLMAYWRQEGLLPPYNPFAVVATGKIQDGCLRHIDYPREKLDGLTERFGEQIVFFYPDNNKAVERQQVPIPTESPVDIVLSKCQEQLESRKNDIGLRNFGIRYYNKRLQSILTSVKKDSEGSWGDIIDFLESIKLDKARYPELYLNSLLVLSFAYCHSAQTAKAHEYNTEAVKFANRAKSLFGLDLQYELLLLSIEEMVLLQDEENFEQILDVSRTISDQLSTLDQNSVASYDLKMRYYGTLGQAHMCGAVCQMKDFDKGAAFDCISIAINNAEKYRKNTKKENIDEVIRDMNYRHLWYVLFDPDSEEEKMSYEVTCEEARKQKPGNSQDSNFNFQFRQKCFVGYRRILLSSANADASYADEPIPAPANIPFWLKALIYKYQAAALAYLHRNAEAKEMFDKSFGSLVEIKDPLIQYIAMTIAAEAYRSFSVLGDAQTAEEYRQKALGLFSSNDNFQKFKATAPRWEHFLDDDMPWDKFQASGEDFPGLHYYY